MANKGFRQTSESPLVTVMGIITGNCSEDEGPCYTTSTKLALAVLRNAVQWEFVPWESGNVHVAESILTPHRTSTRDMI
jgi:hypothetical protein